MAIYALSIKHKAKGKGATGRAHAQYIAREGKYKKLEETRAKSHSEYLTRENKYANRAQELEATWSGNLPNWASSAGEFWAAADTFERANGRVYTEVIIALPRELSFEAREQVVKDFIAKEIGDRFTYTAAIHNPKALDGGEQPHAHVMFSIRERDGIERDKELYFRRANTTSPELGGVKKSREWSMDERSNDRVNQIRATWEELANRALKREGQEARIDRRSLLAQGLDREPEPKMGPEVTQRLKRGLETEVGGKVIELRNYRKQELELNELELELKRELGRDFEEPVIEEENVLTFIKVGLGQKVSDEEQRKYQRSLELVLDKKEIGDSRAEYRWKRSGRLAFTDYGDKIVFNSISETAVKAGLQLAKQKGWKGIKVSGSIEFRRENWIQCQITGYSISGFEPEDRDFELLGERKKAEELKRSRYKEAAGQEQTRESPERALGVREYSAAELEKDLRRDTIPAFEKRKKEIIKEMREMGFEGSPDDPLYWQYKVRKGFDALPSDGELRAKAFELKGGDPYKQMKVQRGKALEAVADYEEKHSILLRKEERSIFQKFAPGHILEKKRLGAELKQAERWASDAMQVIGDEELRLSTGRNKEAFDQTMNQLVVERSATQERRESLLKENRMVSSELSHCYKLRMELKRLGHTKVRAIVERGKIPRVNEQEITQKIREIDELERTRERSLGHGWER